MTKTRKNTKFAKKVSFRKLGSERREKKFRDQQFSCFEQLFLPSKPRFTLFPSPEKKTAFFGKFTFLQGIWKSKNPLFSHIFFCTFCDLPWNRPTHFLQNHVFLCFFANFFFEKKSKKITIFSKKIVSFSWKSWNGLKTLFLPKMVNLAFQKNLEKNVYTKKFRKKLCRKKLDILSKFTIFFCWTRRLTLFCLPWVLMKTRKNCRCGPLDCRVYNFRDFVQIFCVRQKTNIRHYSYTLKTAHLHKMCFAEKKSELDILRKNSDILSKYDIFVVVNYRISHGALPWRMQCTQKPTTFSWPAVTCTHFGIFCKFFVSDPKICVHIVRTPWKQYLRTKCVLQKKCVVGENFVILSKCDIFVGVNCRISQNVLPWRMHFTQKPTIFSWSAVACTHFGILRKFFVSDKKCE